MKLTWAALINQAIPMPTDTAFIVERINNGLIMYGIIYMDRIIIDRGNTFTSAQFYFSAPA